VWEGRVANDSFEALRRGLQTKFRPAAVHATHRPIGRRRAFDRWRATRPFAGAWYELPPPFDSADPLDREEANKERVRVLLDRYGVLFRELLDQEPPHIRWGALFRTLRLMELSGEVVAGQFFDGIHGPQFAAPDAFRTLQSGLAADAIYWLNAADPASLCGVPVTGLRAALPKRLASTHLVYQGTCLVAVSERNAARITFHTGAEEPRLPDYLGVFEHLLARSFLPRASLRVETINGSPATNSPYLDAFRRRFDVAPSPGHVTLRLRT
ncbi:MAG TPA: ATP-dependent helicase, partial [Candidatus Hydrogenedentes bacterium]|nr:ATP-dependent helicase [Candidatus Hydrogenedentota bacterium]